MIVALAFDVEAASPILIQVVFCCHDFRLTPFLEIAHNIALVCKKNVKSGYSQLDPAVAGDRLETRWNLWVPQSFTILDCHDLKLTSP